jgi:hypothetical protein
MRVNKIGRNLVLNKKVCVKLLLQSRMNSKINIKKAEFGSISDHKDSIKKASKGVRLLNILDQGIKAAKIPKVNKAQKQRGKRRRLSCDCC